MQSRILTLKQALLRRQSINKRKAAHSQVELPQKFLNTLLELS
ncbi:hypothetical protein [Limosilactobacillus agrestis]|nr:hypothetical protein [Limosilactobacillus agrestis]